MGFKWSGVNLTGARGESRTVEVVLLDFIVPAVRYIFPCTQTGQIKESMSSRRTAQSLINLNGGGGITGVHSKQAVYSRYTCTQTLHRGDVS